MSNTLQTILQMDLKEAFVNNRDPIENCVRIARNTFKTGRTKPLNFRIKQLKGLLRFFDEQSENIVKVLERDIRKCRHETITCDVDLIANDIRHTINDLHEWIKPEKPNKRLIYLMDNLYIFNDPLGVVLIIGAWNYPFLLTLGPLVGTY